MPWKLFATSVCHAFLGYSVMYQMSVFNPLESSIWNFIEKSLGRYVDQPSDALITVIWAVLNSTITLSWLIGSITLIPIVKDWGRRVCCFFLSPMLLIFGSVTMFCAKYANSFEMLLFGHFLTGISAGFLGFTMACLTEASPAKYKTLVPNIMFLGNPFWVCMGGLIGLPQVLGNEQTWQFALLIPAFPSLIYIIICLVWIPDSPRYLYLKMNQKHEAEQAANFYYGSEVDFKQLTISMDREAELSVNTSTVTICQVFNDNYLRWCLSVVFVAGLASEVGGGAHIVRSYSTEIMHKTMNITVENSALASTFLILIPNGIMSLAGLLLAWKLPRRLHLFSLMVLSEMGLVLVFGSLLAEEYGQHVPYILIGGLFLSMIGYSTGVEAIGASLPGALCPQSAVTVGATVRILSTGGLSVIETQAFPSLRQGIGSYAILICLFPDLFTFLFLYFFMPETKGKNVDQIMDEFYKKELEKTLLLKPSRAK